MTIASLRSYFSRWSTADWVFTAVMVSMLTFIAWGVSRLYREGKADIAAAHEMGIKRDTVVAKVVLTQTEVPGDTLFTVTHDQHLWVWARPHGYRPGVLSHHPSCPCVAR